MLVLTRKVGERIVIDQNITVTVTKVRGNLVTLGVEAPREVSVHRGEIQERIDKKQIRETSRLVPAPSVPIAAMAIGFLGGGGAVPVTS